MIRRALLVVLIVWACTAIAVFVLPDFVPWFLIPETAFLGVVFAGLFLSGFPALLCAASCAFLREAVSSAPQCTMFLGTLALFVAVRHLEHHLIVRNERSVLLSVAMFLLLETVSIRIIMSMRGAGAFPLFWIVEEAVRIALTSLLAVPVFMSLSGRFQKVRE